MKQRLRPAKTWKAIVAELNYKRVNPGSPFGGVRASGHGREMGFEAMCDYTDAKSVWVNVNAQIPLYYPR
jgi:aldehyde dehydrogenase (NAD+)